MSKREREQAKSWRYYLAEHLTENERKKERRQIAKERGLNRKQRRELERLGICRLADGWALVVVD